MSGYGFYFDKDKCVGCRACEVACQLWNDETRTVKWRHVTSVQKGTYPEIVSVNVSLACMHCKDAPCVRACPRQAVVQRADTGPVVVDQQRCVGCMLCLWACPFGAPQLGLNGKMEKCNFCNDRPVGMKRACEEICPTEAIVSGKIADLRKLSKKNLAERILDQQDGAVVLGHEAG